MPPIDLRNGGRKTCVSSITLWLPCPALPRPSGFPPRRKLSWASLAPVRPGDVHLGTSKKFWNSTVGFGSQFYIPWQWKPRPKKKKFASSFHCHCGLDWWFFISCVMLGSAWRLCSIRKCSIGHWTSKDPYHEWGPHIMWCHCPHPLGEGVPQLGLIRWIHLLQRVCGAQRGATRPEAGFYQNVWWF